MKPYYQDKWVTIYHGDCREILPQLEPVDLVLTDPPYGIGVPYSDKYDDSPDGYWDWFLPTIEMVCKKGKITIFTHRNGESQKHLSGWDWMGVWNKPCSFGARVGNSAILPHWEPIYFYGIHTAGVYGEYCGDVLTFNPVKAGGLSGIGRKKWQGNVDCTYHPCPKPIGLFQKLIQVFSPCNAAILDPFLGSGTTCYCAKKLNRYSIGIEIEEKYCEIAAKRCSQEAMELNCEPKEFSFNTRTGGYVERI